MICVLNAFRRLKMPNFYKYRKLFRMLLRLYPNTSHYYKRTTCKYSEHRVCVCVGGGGGGGGGAGYENIL